MHQITMIAIANQTLKTIKPYEINPVTSKKIERIVIANIDSAIESRYFLDMFILFVYSPTIPRSSSKNQRTHSKQIRLLSSFTQKKMLPMDRWQKY
jgi:hypothetical protein